MNVDRTIGGDRTIIDRAVGGEGSVASALGGVRTMKSDERNAPRTDLELKPGLVLVGKYRLERELGVGGMGAVWLAMDLLLEKPMALKFLSTHFAGDDRALVRIRREAEVSMELRDDHIVTIRTVNVHEGVPFLVMDYIDGETLSERLARVHKLSEEEAQRILYPIARALDYAHRKEPPVIHRDVKPSNVMISNEGKSFILDFGIAKVVDADPRSMRTISGTPRYMSPQQLIGDKPSPKDDIYSFAMMAYECLTGDVFSSGNGAQPQLPGTSYFSMAVCEGLHVDAQKRPQTCEDIIREPYRSPEERARRARADFEAGRMERACAMALKLENKPADIQFWLGVCSCLGQGIGRNVDAAISFFRGAADLGHVEAMETLGYGYVSGKMGSRWPKDEQEGARWLRLAAEKGSHRAQGNLALCYEHGVGVKPDQTEMIKWYKLSARGD